MYTVVYLLLYRTVTEYNNNMRIIISNVAQNLFLSLLVFSRCFGLHLIVHLMLVKLNLAKSLAG